MRDYFLHPAQTNLELYAQVIECGYGEQQRSRLADAYHFALQQVFPLARGSGKPFIAHLVGTASLVLASGCSDDWVIAALLHALYQRRIPFIDGLAPPERRSLLAGRVGRGVDDLVHRYTEFESQNLPEVTGDFINGNTDVVTLRLADELEDLCYHAPALHGRVTEDDPDIRGSYCWRERVKVAETPALLALATGLGLDGLQRGLAHWLDFASTPTDLRQMRTGWLSSVNLATENSSRDTGVT